MAWCYKKVPKKSHEHYTLRWWDYRCPPNIAIRMHTSTLKDKAIEIYYELLIWMSSREQMRKIDNTNLVDWSASPPVANKLDNKIRSIIRHLASYYHKIHNLLPLTVGQSSRGINTSFSGLSAREWSIRMASARARRSKYCSVSWDDMFSSDLVSCESQAGACSATNSRSGLNMYYSYYIYL